MVENGFVDDLVLSGMLHAAVVRSTLPHARLAGSEKDPAFDWADIVIADVQDIPGVNFCAPFPSDQPVLAGGVCRHVGEPVLLLAAASRSRVMQARRHLKLLETPLAALVDWPWALRHCDADGVSVHCRRNLEKGDGHGCIERALTADPSAILVEGCYETGAQEHLYLEPQGVLARPLDDGGIEVRGSMQCPFYVAEALAGVLALPRERVRVIQCPTGGGFGGKEDYPSLLAAHAALLARKAQRPVKLVLERSEDMAVTTHRHPALIRHRTAVRPDGRLLACEIEILLDGGAYTTLSPGVLTRAMLHALGPYRCSHAAVNGTVVATNLPPRGAFRGFGAAQACFAAERQMDRIAAQLHLDPVELRRRNLLRVGDTTLTGQRLQAPVALEEVLERALLAADWERRRSVAEAANRQGDSTPARPLPGGGQTPQLRGVGLSLFVHGAGFTGNREEQIAAEVTLELAPSGRVNVRSSAVDMGQGARESLARIAALALGIEPELVEVIHPDTAYCPDSGPSIASRTCMVVGELVRRAALRLRERVAGTATDTAPPWPTAVARYLATGGDTLINERYRPIPVEWDPEQLRGDAYPCFGWGCDVAEVEVDPNTFEVNVTGLWTAHDVGRAIAPLVVAGQVEGGCVQGLGFALTESLVTRHGRLRNDSLADYTIPTMLDAPELDTQLVEAPCSSGPFGAKGMGEMPVDGPAPALAAAIEHATGIQPRLLPMTPESLLAASQGEEEC